MINERFNRINAADDAALAGRDPSDVDIADLLPGIFAAVPDATVPEIRQALIAEAERLASEADALEADLRRGHEPRTPPANDNGAASPA